MGVEGDKVLCVQNIYEPVDGAAGVKSAVPRGVEGEKELCVQNVPMHL